MKRKRPLLLSIYFDIPRSIRKLAPIVARLTFASLRALPFFLASTVLPEFRRLMAWKQVKHLNLNARQQSACVFSEGGCSFKDQVFVWLASESRSGTSTVIVALRTMSLPAVSPS